MPWTVDDVERFHKGLTNKEKRQWVEVANSVLERCLEEGKDQNTCEVSAIKQANGVVGTTVIHLLIPMQDTLYQLRSMKAKNI